MPAAHHTVSFSFNARYFSEGNPEADTIWLCLHGYAQLAPYFIKKFQRIAKNDLVLVPEGLHRFYMQDGSGRVVASWMTKEDRETDIQNYLRYLDEVVNAAMLARRNKNPRLILLGFSQGVATACRYYAHSAHDFSDIVLWAGVLPPDLDLSALKAKKFRGHFHLIQGDKDPYKEDATYDKSISLLSELDIPFDSRTFNGAHEISEEELNFLMDKLRR